MTTGLRLLEPMEVGSLRAATFAEALRNHATFDSERSKKALAEINQWQETAKIPEQDVAELKKLIQTPEKDEKWYDKAIRLSLALPVRYFQSAGLRVYSPSGEWHLIKGDMYQWEIHQLEGIKLGTDYARSFDDRIWLPGIIEGPIRLNHAFPNDEVNIALNYANKGDVIKFAFSGALTQIFWSMNEYYKDVREAVLDYAKEVMRPNIKDMIKRGASIIKIDEPQAHQLGAKLCAEAFNEAIKGIKGEFYLHMCFGKYREEIFPDIMEAKDCKLFTLELANGDPWEINSGHTGYDFLKDFAQYNDGRAIGVGLFDIHNPRVESKELQQKRLEVAIKNLGDPKYAYPFPDCGGRQLHPFDAYLPKLKNMVAAADAVRANYE